VAALTKAVGDFDGDGLQDLVVANNYNSETVSILLGNGDGTFQTAQSFGTGTGSKPSGVAVGDFNNDRKPDIVVADDVSNTVTVLINTSQPTPGPEL
jgi:FG-GAP-like repeat